MNTKFDKNLKYETKKYYIEDKKLSARIAKMESDLRTMKKMFRQDNRL